MLGTTRLMVGIRLTAHASALLERQLLQHQSAQWLIRWRLDEWNMWTMWRQNNTRPPQLVGAKSKGAHRASERVYDQSHRPVARRSLPNDDSDSSNCGSCMAITVRTAPMLIPQGGSLMGESMG